MEYDLSSPCPQNWERVCEDSVIDEFVLIIASQKRVMSLEYMKRLCTGLKLRTWIFLESTQLQAMKRWPVSTRRIREHASTSSSGEHAWGWRKLWQIEPPSDPGYFTTEVESYLFAAHRRDIHGVIVENLWNTGSRLRLKHPSSKTKQECSAKQKALLAAPGDRRWRISPILEGKDYRQVVFIKRRKSCSRCYDQIDV